MSARFDLGRADTICAAATPELPAALAIVRVSGRDADAIRARVFRPHRGAQRAFMATLGDVVDAQGALLDEALCTAFPDGKSYTGEAAFELSLHGGPSRVRAALRALLDAGARLAEPGEFTMRAVLTGRLDLCAAEAVSDVIAARSDDAARAALKTLQGGLGARLAPSRAAIVDALAELEARLDFPDEDLGDAARDGVADALERARGDLQRLLAGAAYGQRLSRGARVVLYGAPNAGKSTLLNALLDEERALVHESPGTTRDVLEAHAVFGGVPATLIDVAGIRDDADIHPVEALGIARARAERARADIVVLTIAATSVDPAAEVRALRADVQAPVLVALTKVDLVPGAALEGAVPVSAPTRHGLDALRAAIGAALASDATLGDEVVLTRERQEHEVRAAHGALAMALHALRRGEPHEVVASELRQAGGALDRLLGGALGEDVLELIFSRFCIGK